MGLTYMPMQYEHWTYADVISNVIWEIERWSRHGNWYETIIYCTGCKCGIDKPGSLCVNGGRVVKLGIIETKNSDQGLKKNLRDAFWERFKWEIQLIITLIQHYFLKFSNVKSMLHDRRFQFFWCQRPQNMMIPFLKYNGSNITDSIK